MALAISVCFRLTFGLFVDQAVGSRGPLVVQVYRSRWLSTFGAWDLAMGSAADPWKASNR